MQTALHAGRDIDRFRIIGKLASGGFATVYLATVAGPSKFNKLVVLKIMDDELASDSRFVRMFLDEARLAAQLSHPNVVQTYEVLESQGRFMLVMEYLEGFSLKDLRRRATQRGPLPLPLHLSVIAQSLAGLQYAHELTDFHGEPLSLVHRDIKPANLFVTFDGLCKVLDFGIAKTTQSTERTRGGTIKGTIRHMAPECFRKEPLDRRADIFAAGTVIWEAATGRRMWKGGTDLSIMRAILEGDIPTAVSVDPSVPAELDAICHRAMAHEREDRYATAEELRVDLEAFIERNGGLVPPRRVGRLMAEWFAEDRAEIKRVTSREIAACDADPDRSRPVVTLRKTTADEESAVSGVELRSTGGDSVTRRSKARPALIGGLLVVSGAVAASVASLGTPEHDNAVRMRAVKAETAKATHIGSQSNTQEVTLGAAEMAADSRVRIRLSADPPHATLFIDGEQVDSNPAEIRIARVEEPVQVRAEAPGYRSNETTLVPDRDREVSLALVPERSRRRVRRREPTQASERQEAAAPTAMQTQPSASTGRAGARQATGESPTSNSLDVDSSSPWGRQRSGARRLGLDEGDPWTQ